MVEGLEYSLLFGFNLKMRTAVTEEKVKIACVVHTYNRGHFIEQCIESILSQKTQYRFRIIVIDDCSADDTRDVVEALQSKHPDSEILFFTSEKNLGLGKFVAQSLRKELEPFFQTDYLYRIDSDDFINDPEKFEKQVSFLEAHPECVGICHHYYLLDENTGTRTIANQALTGIYSALELVQKFGVYHMYNHTSTYMFRNVHQFVLPPEFERKEVKGDVLYNWAMMRHGKVCYTDDVMSTYRLHNDGIWQALSDEEKKRFNDRLIVGIYRMLSVKNKLRLFFPLVGKGIKKFKNRLFAG